VLLLFSVKTLLVDAAFVLLPEAARTPELEVDLLELEAVTPLALLFLELLSETPELLLPSFLATVVPVDLRCPYV